MFETFKSEEGDVFQISTFLGLVSGGETGMVL